MLYSCNHLVKETGHTRQVQVPQLMGAYILLRWTGLPLWDSFATAVLLFAAVISQVFGNLGVVHFGVLVLLCFNVSHLRVCYKSVLRMQQETCGHITRRKACELGRKKSATETEVKSLQTSRRHSSSSWASSSHLLQVIPHPSITISVMI